MGSRNLLYLKILFSIEHFHARQLQGLQFLFHVNESSAPLIFECHTLAMCGIPFSLLNHLSGSCYIQDYLWVSDQADA